MAPTIDDPLRSDHERLGVLLTRLKERARGPDPEASRVLLELSTGLRRHIDFEERELFPTLRRSPRPPLERTIESLVIDHQVILEKLETLRIHLEQGRGVEAEQTATDLEIYLEGHNRDEEIGLYSHAARGITAAEHETLVRKFQGDP
jgi:hemerythrin-like domain-containing protein